MKTKTLNEIKNSDEMKRVIEAYGRSQHLFWTMASVISKAVGAPYRKDDEPLSEWGKRLDEYDKFVNSPELQCKWINEDGDTEAGEPFSFLRTEIRRCRKLLNEAKSS